MNALIEFALIMVLFVAIYFGARAWTELIIRQIHGDWSMTKGRSRDAEHYEYVPTGKYP